QEPLELFFYAPLLGAREMPAVEMEERGKGHQDFWYANANDEAVKLGLSFKACTCSSVELFQLPSNGRERLVNVAAAVHGAGISAMNGLGSLRVVCAAAVGTWAAQKGVSSKELVVNREEVVSVTIDPGTVGWVRLAWRGEKPGVQRLGARLWMGDV